MRTPSDEALLAGELGEEEPELTAFVAALRAVGRAPAPAPSPALREILEHGRHPRADGTTALSRSELLVASASTDVSDASVDLARRRRERGVRAGEKDSGSGRPRRRGLIVGARIGAAAVAVAMVGTGAAALEPMPEGVREPARALLSAVADAVTPWRDAQAPGSGDGTSGDRSDGESGRGDVPGESGRGGAPDESGRGDAPGDPPPSEVPVLPLPGSSADPSRPDAPGRPASPGDDVPGAPSSPTRPGNGPALVRPHAPGAPTQPERPAAPGRPDESGAPERGGVGTPEGSARTTGSAGDTMRVSEDAARSLVASEGPEAPGRQPAP